ncbi:MAG: hypothetical protein SGJ04_03470 [Bacteroidota bacterium]|nr:hypothetical protein [Bacteroidota bacterium]
MGTVFKIFLVLVVLAAFGFIGWGAVTGLVKIILYVVLALAVLGFLVGGRLFGRSSD